jgi:hypothetical protein
VTRPKRGYGGEVLSLVYECTGHVANSAVDESNSRDGIKSVIS